MNIKQSHHYETRQALFFFSLIFLLPDTFYYLLGINNFSISSLISFFLVFIFIKNKYISNSTLFILPMVCFILLFNLVCTFIINENLEINIKLVLSLLAPVIMLCTADIFAGELIKLSGFAIIKAIKKLYIVTLLIAFSSLLLMHVGFFPGKSMILFFEPSAFALIYAPIFSFTLFYSSKKMGMLLILISIIIGLLIQNLTLLISILFSMILLRRLSIIQIFFSILIIVCISLFWGSNYNFNYFLERLNFSDSNNLSVLVYLSGIERAYLNFINSNGLGIGFQQMGFNHLIGHSQAVLEKLHAGNLNIYDGSFIASKLISEFGFIGLSLCVIYVFMLGKIYISFYRTEDKSPIDVLAYCLYFSFFIPFFVRGAGYINPYIFSFILSIFLTLRNSKRKIL